MISHNPHINVPILINHCNKTRDNTNCLLNMQHWHPTEAWQQQNWFCIPKAEHKVGYTAISAWERSDTIMKFPALTQANSGLYLLFSNNTKKERLSWKKKTPKTLIPPDQRLSLNFTIHSAPRSMFSQSTPTLTAICRNESSLQDIWLVLRRQHAGEINRRNYWGVTDSAVSGATPGAILISHIWQSDGPNLSPLVFVRARTLTYQPDICFPFCCCFLVPLLGFWNIDPNTDCYLSEDKLIREAADKHQRAAKFFVKDIRLVA